MNEGFSDLMLGLARFDMTVLAMRRDFSLTWATKD